MSMLKAEPGLGPDQHNQMSLDSGKTVVLAALGRPFSLGMLYDCRNDSLIPALTLWDREALEKYTDERPQPNSDFEIVASDSIEDKFSALNVEGSMKASFLGGLVEIEGSAKFLSNSKSSRNQARVTLKYCTTTKFQQLSMNHIGEGNMKYSDVLKSEQATHVVTGILYGALAFFVFDREVSEKEDRQDIEGNLKGLIQKIPKLTVDIQGNLTMADKDKINVDKFSCKFHGDFNLDKHPVSFDEAIKVYKSLPNLIGTKGENAVPLKVWLYPLKNLDSAAAELVRQISDGLVRNAQNVLEDFSELERRCNDTEKCGKFQQFPQINKKVKAFKELVSQYKLKFESNMAKNIPLIRGGREKEGVLAEILEKVHSSPFKINELNDWMESKEMEINFICSCIVKMPNLPILTSRSTLHNEIHSGDIPHAVCFAFTSLETPESYLSALSKFLNETKPDNVPCAYDVEKPWFDSNDVMDEVKEKIKLFQDFAEANKESNSIRFLTAVIRDDEKKGATLHLYKNGSLVTDNFEPPMKPKMIPGDITHNSVTLNISPSRFGLTTVTDYTVEFCDGDDVWHQQMETNAGDVTVSGLKINEEYQFRCRAKCKVGLGPAFEAKIKTLPCGPPEKLHVDCYPTDLAVSWEEPSDLGRGVEIKHYILDYAETSQKVKPEEYIWNKQTFKANESQRVTVIPGLHPSTQYTVRVKCDVGVAGLGKEESVVVFTEKPYEQLAETVKKEGRKIEGLPGTLDFYTLPLKAQSMNVEGCKRFIFGKDSLKRNCTFMVLGATGAGKSTLVNRIINYILGVTWDDTFRFKLVDEDTNKSQAHSQTSEVTVYKLNHREGFQIDFSLTIVDTPGFCHTGGKKKDLLIVPKLQKLFSAKHGVSEIDAICFVAQASLARLTESQKHVFNSVLNIFGKDVAENIRILVTFSDGTKPPVLEAIKEAEFPCSQDEDGSPINFKFNNSDEKLCGPLGAFNKLFWDMGKEGMEKIFSGLEAINAKSLTLTKEVLRQRAQLQNSIRNVKIKLNLGLTKLGEIEQERKILQKHEMAITANEQFEYETSITKPVQVKASIFSLNCKTCKVTCHKSCGAFLGVRYLCEVFTWGATCVECKGMCPLSAHVREGFYWGSETVKEKQTYKELKEKYEEASMAALSVGDIIKKTEQEYDCLQDELVRLMERAAQCLNTLKKIALKPDPLSIPEYIDLLIEGEESEFKPGYLERINKLQELKKKAITMEIVASGATVSDIDAEQVQWLGPLPAQKGLDSYDDLFFAY
ncbi:unnamed protein product [Gadus morhua 'NCC']